MLWELSFLTGFLYCSAVQVNLTCSSDCTTEKVLGYDLEDFENFEFQGKYIVQ